MIIGVPESTCKYPRFVADGIKRRNAGCWCIGITRTGNGVGLSVDEINSLPAAEVQKRCDAAKRQLLSAGAHYTIESVADIKEIIIDIDGRLRRGETPQPFGI